ncbi:MAG: hypothetical protein V1708_04020 [Candidatus Micrarchaeota archaeon]
MEPSFAVMWALSFAYLYIERQYMAGIVLAVLAILCGAIPVTIPW